MAPAVIHQLVTKLSARSANPDPTNVFDKGPLFARAMLLARDKPTATADPHKGVIPPMSFNNNGMFALFGILGAAICVAIIWFFFWAKNGGFYFKENDWEEYKSTVLRRRGPNGTILSNATPSTNLGGGSVYKDVHDYTEDTTTVVTDSTATSGSSGMTGITAGVSDIVGREKRRKKREQREREKEREKERRREEKDNKRHKKDLLKEKKKSRSSRKVNEDGVLIDEDAEAAAQEYLRDYRHEKAARVGGINKASDSSAWDGSTDPGTSTAASETTATSELMSNREHTPTNTPTKKSGGGIRKVYSTADRNAMREQERARAEARRLQQEARRGMVQHNVSHHGGNSRRDFSWQYGEDASTPLRQIDESTGNGREDDGHSTHVPGGWSESGVSESDLGTKSYRHYIPGLSSSAAGSGAGSAVGSAVGSAAGSAAETNDHSYVEDKRKQRQQRNAGYRRP